MYRAALIVVFFAPLCLRAGEPAAPVAAKTVRPVPATAQPANPTTPTAYPSTVYPGGQYPAASGYGGTSPTNPYGSAGYSGTSPANPYGSTAYGAASSCGSSYPAATVTPVYGPGGGYAATSCSSAVPANPYGSTAYGAASKPAAGVASAKARELLRKNPKLVRVLVESLASAPCAELTLLGSSLQDPPTSQWPFVVHLAALHALGVAAVPDLLRAVNDKDAGVAIASLCVLSADSATCDDFPHQRVVASLLESRETQSKEVRPYIQAAISLVVTQQCAPDQAMPDAGGEVFILGLKACQGKIRPGNGHPTGGPETAR